MYSYCFPAVRIKHIYTKILLCGKITLFCTYTCKLIKKQSFRIMFSRQFNFTTINELNISRYCWLICIQWFYLKSFTFRLFNIDNMNGIISIGCGLNPFIDCIVCSIVAFYHSCHIWIVIINVISIPWKEPFRLTVLIIRLCNDRCPLTYSLIHKYSRKYNIRWSLNN